MVVANDDRRSATMAASSDRIIDSKMDKASIIKDAIDYIQELHEQERRIQADLMQLESGKLKKNAVFDLDQEIPTLSRLKKKRIDHSYDSRRSTTSSIEDLEYAAAREWTKWELMTAHLLPNEDNIKKGDDDKFSLVLSGEMKTVTYLDTEQKLVLPEIGYQLLHNYADQIQNWGWLCNIRSLGSRSFKKNLNLLHRQSTVVTLNAVPCIVGVNLTDVDLLEFLQQLADTDGSSTIPPSVHRVLNSKACRGAIMFGDTLLPSECSLIVEELKQTSLCFQCAHGRPTTVPLVNLEALHKQIAKLGLWNGGSNELWHGLHQHEPSLERAALRLSSARGLS